MKKLKLKTKILSGLLALLMLTQVAWLPIAAVSDEIAEFLSGGSSATTDILPDAGEGSWDIPLATTNPNKVKTDVPVKAIYNTQLFNVLDSAGLVTNGYGVSSVYASQWSTYNPETKQHVGYMRYYWASNSVIRYVDPATERVAATNDNKLYMRGTLTNGQGSIVYSVNGTKQEVSNTVTNGNVILEQTAAIPAGSTGSVSFRVPGEPQSNISHLVTAYIDDTSPVARAISVSQDNNMLVIEITYDEELRFASGEVADKLNDLWIEVEVQVAGSEYKQILRAHLAGIGGYNSWSKQSGGQNKLVFKGDLGPLATLDYTVNDITNVNLGIDNYTVTYGYTNFSVGALSSSTTRRLEGKTYQTTAICDHAGNPILEASIVNWQLGDRMLQNDTTYLTYIDLISTKTATVHSADTNADGFATDKNLGEYYYGPGDEISFQVGLNRILTDAEVKTFRARVTIQDANGDYIWVKVKSSGKYKIGSREYMYLDLTPITITPNMIATPEPGQSLPYIQLHDFTFDAISSPKMNSLLPEQNGSLYVDMTLPEVTMVTESLTEPRLTDGYFPLSLKLTVKDGLYDGTLLSGIVGSFAQIYVGANVNEAVTVRYLVNGTSGIPAFSEFSAGVELAPGGKLLVTGEVPDGEEGGYPLLSEETDIYVHLLFALKENLLIDGVSLYVDAADLVGNRSDVKEPLSVDFMVDRQKPTIAVTGTSVAYNTDSATAKVNLLISDYNEVTAIRYQWTARGAEPTDEGWQALSFDRGGRVNVTVRSDSLTGEQGGVHELTLHVWCEDDRGNVSLTTTKDVTVNIERPVTSYEVVSDLSIPSTDPEIKVSGPEKSPSGLTGYTRVTLIPTSPAADWAYVTQVESGKLLDVFALDSAHGQKWYKVSFDGDRYNSVAQVNGTDATFDDLLKYYGELKITFESAYADLTPVIGYMNLTVQNGSYVKEEAFLTARFAARNSEIHGVHSVDFGRINDRDGSLLSTDGDLGGQPLSFSTSIMGDNPMRGITVHYSIANLLKSQWGLSDIDFEKSYVELYRTNTEGRRLMATQQGIAKSQSQYYTIPALCDDGSWFDTGMYTVEVHIVSYSGSNDSAVSLNLVLDASTPVNDGLVKYSHTLRYGLYDDYVVENVADTTFSSFGVTLAPGVESMRNNIFAVYTGGVLSYSFAIGADNTQTVYDGIATGGVKGFRYWNALAEPTAEEVEELYFISSEAESDRVYRTVSGRIYTIYTEETAPKGADGLGYIWLVEGVNTICYQTKMENGYISPVRYFTIVLTTQTPEFNVVLDSYTPSHELSQREGQINAHDVTVRVEEAFSINGSGKVDVQVWSSYAMEISGEWVAESEENEYSASLGLLTGGLGADDTVVLTQDSYTTCFPPYSGQGNYCTVALVALDEYGGMCVFAPQIGALDRLDDRSNPYDDLYSINYEGGYQDDPYTVGVDFNLRTMYNQPVYFGAELVRFENRFSYDNGPFEVIETSIPEIRYNLFAIVSNNVYFGAPSATGLSSDLSRGNMYTIGEDLFNYDLIDWSNTTITITDESGRVLAAGLDVRNPGDNVAGFIGGYYGNYYYPSLSGGEPEYFDAFTVSFASPAADADHAVGDALYRSYHISGVNIYGNPFDVGGSVRLNYINYSAAITESVTNHGVVLRLPFITREYGSSISTGIFKNELYEDTVTDLFGNTHTISYQIKGSADPNTDITYASTSEFADPARPQAATSEPMQITIKREDGKRIYVDIPDTAIMSVEYKSQSEVVVTVTENMTFTYRYADENGAERMFFVDVVNIVKPQPYAATDRDLENHMTDEDGTAYLYGSVTVSLQDANFFLRDEYTNFAPSYTFVPGGPTSYTFTKESIVAKYGEESLKALPEDITFILDVELREEPAADGEEDSSADTLPGIRLDAFIEEDGYYRDTFYALTLEPAGQEDTLFETNNYINFSYSGNRASAAALMEKMGWAASYRFVVDHSYSSGTKVVIKQGLYGEVPDFETATNDYVKGVSMNGRLLTVTENTTFTLFVLAKDGKYASVVFDVTNVGDAPVPTVVKVPLEQGGVKVFVLAPTADGVTDFSFASADFGVELRTETEGDYAGLPYVLFDKNDEYTLRYSYTFQGATVTGSVDTFVHEIRVREMEQVGTIRWSANSTESIVSNVITATATFSELITGYEVVEGTVDEESVEISYLGKQIKVRFSDNHGAIALKCQSAWGDVIVYFDAVGNFDREPPVIKEVSREVASNGKSVLITLSTSERAVFKEGGYIGTESTDAQGNVIYLFTRTVTENGSYTFHFADMVGINASITVEVTEIVTEPLSLLFSLTGREADAVTDPARLELEAGYTVYIRPGRTAFISLNGEEAVSVEGGTWKGFTIAVDLGGSYPFVTATDAYGNAVIYQFSQIIPVDIIAPIANVRKPVISATLGSDREELRERLLENVYGVDEDPNLTYEVEFTEDLSLSGVTAVYYTVSDSSGNVSTAECRLRLISGVEPLVYINGTQIDREGSYIAAAGESMTLTVDVDGQPYCVYMEDGIKTVSQTKIGHTDLTEGYITDTTVELGVLEKGYYTIVIQTQSRDYFRILIYCY